MFHYAYLITSLAVGQVCIPFHRKIDAKVQDNFLHDIQPLKRQEISAKLYKSKKKKSFLSFPVADWFLTFTSFRYYLVNFSGY